MAATSAATELQRTCQPERYPASWNPSSNSALRLLPSEFAVTYCPCCRAYCTHILWRTRQGGRIRRGWCQFHALGQPGSESRPPRLSQPQKATVCRMSIHSRRGESPKRMVSLESWTWWWYTTTTIRPTWSQPQLIFSVSPIKSCFLNNKLKGSDQ